MLSYDNYSFFFFQAEDGIRDRTVTGVQTCALPIFWVLRHGTDEGSQDPDHKFLPDAPVGYGLSRGPDRHPEPSDRGSDRAFQRARQGSSFSPRPAEDGRDPPPPPGLPQGQERGALPRADQEARDSQIGRHGDPGRRHPRAVSARTGWQRATHTIDSGELQKGTLSSYLPLTLQSSLPP